MLELQAVVAGKWRRPVPEHELEPKQKPKPVQPPRMLRVHIWRGRFVTCCTVDDNDQGAQVMMDAEVWSKLPGTASMGGGAVCARGKAVPAALGEP